MKLLIRKLMGIRYECENCGKRFDKPSKKVFAVNWQKVDACPTCNSTRIKNV